MDFSVQNYLTQHNNVIEKLDIFEIQNAVNLIKDKFTRGNKIAICGNGGSALTASHYITDWNKMVYQYTGKIFNGICLNDNMGLVTAYANDFSYDEIFSEQVKYLLNEGDLLITVSGSGNSKNVIKATQVALENNVETLSVCGYDGGKLREISNNSVWVNSFDMQICEDAHLVFGHIVMKSLCNQKIFK